MKIISHRGNTLGKLPDLENNPHYIDKAISYGFDVEVDVWVVDDELSLGHDFPQFPVSITWLQERSEVLWIHCKNIEAVTYFSRHDAIFSSKGTTFNFFWHETDQVTLTSKGAIWAFPGNQPISCSIAVLPELNDDDLSQCFGICSDFPMNYV